MEPTRIIPITPTKGDGSQQPSNVPRQELEPGLIKIEMAKGREGSSGGDSDATQRFTSEVKYVSYFAQRLAESLGMRQLVMGVVEDREGQTSFYSSATGWHGSVSSNRRSVRQLREALSRS